MIQRSQILFILALGLLLAPVASAWHSNDPATESKSCSGAHCTIIGFWNAWGGDKPPTTSNALLASTVGQLTLHGTASLYTAISAPATGIIANCEAGETVQVPIQASGELVGAGRAFWDSPPIQFHPKGLVRAITEGIPYTCELGADKEGEGICAREFNKPIEGEWRDTWTTTGVSGGGVTCSTNEDGKTATCVVAPGTTGAPQISLSRSVNNLFWQIGEARFRTQPAVLPAVLTSSATVACRAASAPNLTINEISILPTKPVHREPIDLNAIVANTGTQNAVATVTRVRFDENADGSWNIGPLDVATPALAQSATSIASWVNAWQAPGGTHRVEVCADATARVTEANESDNCKVLVFSVTKPALACAPATSTATTATPATFTATGGNTFPPYYQWVAAEGTPAVGSGPTFATTHTTPGQKTVGLVEYFIDVNGDGVGNAFDVQAIFSNLNGAAAGSGARWQNQANRFDVNNDGTVNVFDGQIAGRYINEQGGGPLPQVNCAVAIDSAPVVDTTPVATIKPPGSDTLCSPLKQAVAVGKTASFENPSGVPSTWSAPGGTPATAANTTTFSTQYATPGEYVVSVALPPSFDTSQGVPALECRVEVVRVGATPIPSVSPQPTGGPFNPGPIRETE